MMRTTFYIPETLYHRLHMVSKRHETSVSKMVKQLLDHALEAEEQKQIQEMYAALQKIKGIGKDASINPHSIDEILYGENGAWRGEPSDNGLWEMPDTTKNV